MAKPEKNKGAQKQEIWTECIQELAERQNIDRNIRNVLQRIATQSNVPRKKPKFVNFLKSSMRFNPNQAEQVWTIIEKGLEEFKNKTAPPPPPPPTAAAQDVASNPEAAATNGNESINGGHSSADSKESESENENATNGVSNVSLSVESIIGHAVAQPNIAKSTKKLLKKLQKRNDIPLNVQSPKKKKFIKYLQDQLQLDADNSNTVWECLLQSIHALSSNVNGISNDKGKKRKNTDESGVDSKRPKTEISLADSTTDANGESTFDWQKHILRIFNKSQINHQLPIDSLRSKVIKKFLKSVGEDESNGGKYEKKFKKNLKKVNSLAIAGEVVLLKA